MTASKSTPLCLLPGWTLMWSIMQATVDPYQRRVSLMLLQIHKLYGYPASFGLAFCDPDLR